MPQEGSQSFILKGAQSARAELLAFYDSRTSTGSHLRTTNGLARAADAIISARALWPTLSGSVTKSNGRGFRHTQEAGHDATRSNHRLCHHCCARTRESCFGGRYAVWNPVHPLPERTGHLGAMPGQIRQAHLLPAARPILQHATTAIRSASAIRSATAIRSPLNDRQLQWPSW
jgi:hypothetical protein